MNIQLLSNRVLIKTDEKEVKTASGVIITKNLQPGDINSGVIVAVGTGKDTEQGHVSMKVKVGDQVMYHYGSKVQVEGESYVLANEDDIIAITKPA